MEILPVKFYIKGKFQCLARNSAAFRELLALYIYVLCHVTYKNCCEHTTVLRYED